MNNTITFLDEDALVRFIMAQYRLGDTHVWNVEQKGDGSYLMTFTGGA